MYPCFILHFSLIIIIVVNANYFIAKHYKLNVYYDTISICQFVLMELKTANSNMKHGICLVRKQLG